VSCENAAPCCEKNDFTFSVARCEKAITREEKEGLGSPDRGGSVIDAAAAADCLARRRKAIATCGDVDLAEMTRTELVCARVFSKRSPPGGPCKWQGDCAAGTDEPIYCVADPEKPEVDEVDRHARCSAHPKPAVGQACKWAREGDVRYCEEAGLRCDATRDTCQALGGADETCDSPEDCTAGFVCLAGVCKTAGGEGTDCEGNEACALGSYCDPTTRHCAKGKPVGATCGVPFECASYACANGRCLANSFGTRRRCGEPRVK
jgi:hypothetical protein